MPLDDHDVQSEAALLDEAERTATSIRPTTIRHPDATIDDAYRIQAAWLERKLEQGEQVVGHKIGLTSRAMQQAMHITTPDSGFLTEAMVFAPDSELETARFCDPKIEVELAFVLGADLVGPAATVDPAELTVEGVLAATEHVTPAIELIDARSHRVDPDTGRTRTVVDTIADNAADAGIICGGQPIPTDGVDLRWVGAVASRNGVVEETGLAAAVLGHPAEGIVWLARRYADQGLQLEAGHTVLAGSFTRPLAAAAGDDFDFDFGPWGRFGLHFR